MTLLISRKAFCADLPPKDLHLVALGSSSDTRLKEGGVLETMSSCVFPQRLSNGGSLRHDLVGCESPALVEVSSFDE